jgi:type III secretory pathway component EscU
MTEDNVTADNVTVDNGTDYDYWYYNTTDYCSVEQGCMMGLHNLIVPILFAVIMLVGCLGNGFVALVVLKNRDQVGVLFVSDCVKFSQVSIVFVHGRVKPQGC